MSSDIICRIAHANFYAGNLKAVYHTEARQAINYVAGGLSRVGRNVNQSANAMHRAVGQSDNAAMREAAAEMKTWAEDISAAIDVAVEHCHAVTAADAQFWRVEAVKMKVKNKTRTEVT